VKKSIIIAVVAALILTTLIPGVAYAGSKYSNASAEFVMPGGGSDTGGHAIINYAKGANKWIVHGEVWNLDPDKTYYVTVGTGGVWSWWVVAQFTTDGSGNGSFHEQVDTEHPFHNSTITRQVANGDTYNIVRIWRVASLSPLRADPHYLVANEPFQGGSYSPETHGVLTFWGERRGK